MTMPSQPFGLVIFSPLAFACLRLIHSLPLLLYSVVIIIFSQATLSFTRAVMGVL